MRFIITRNERTMFLPQTVSPHFSSLFLSLPLCVCPTFGSLSFCPLSQTCTNYNTFASLIADSAVFVNSPQPRGVRSPAGVDGRWLTLRAG